MISMHPTKVLLQQFVEGSLPASLSVAVAIHCEFCEICQRLTQQMTEQQAKLAMAEMVTETEPSLATDFDAMIASITCDNDILEPAILPDVEIEVAGQRYVMPRALHSVPMLGWQRLGNFSRSRLDFNEGKLHSNILHIAPGGTVPHHGHKGYELTLLLAGSFSDESGNYHQGDFIMLDAEHQHTPFSEEGCLCMTVADDAMHFTHGLGKLFNPLINYLY